MYETGKKLEKKAMDAYEKLMEHDTVIENGLLQLSMKNIRKHWIWNSPTGKSAMR